MEFIIFGWTEEYILTELFIAGPPQGQTVCIFSQISITLGIETFAYKEDFCTELQEAVPGAEGELLYSPSSLDSLQFGGKMMQSQE